MILFIILFFTTADASPRLDYRDDYRYEDAYQSFYKTHPEGLSWHEALIRCQAEGTELMVPESLDEADSAMLLIASHVNPQHQGVYLGIHDLYSERIFVTLDGSPVQNTLLELLWLYEEPRANGGRCVAMKRNGRLFVNPCDSPLPFVCKIKDDDIVYHKSCDTYNPDWKKGPEGHCYISHKEPQTWFDAYATCLAAGGHLAVLDNRPEADFIRDLFKNITDLQQPHSDFAFLGFSDLLQKHNFVTVHGLPLDQTGFSDWDRKCPAGERFKKTDKRCGGIMRSGLLTSGDCNVPATFFCERPPSLMSRTRNQTVDNETVPNYLRQHLSSSKRILPAVTGKRRLQSREKELTTASDIGLSDLAKSCNSSCDEKIPQDALNQWTAIYKSLQSRFFTPSNRWYKTYMTELQQRSTWNATKGELTKNALVLVKDDNFQPLKWKFARIAEVIHPEQDKFNKADILTSTGVTRPALSVTSFYRSRRLS